jgi:hypothetical protein
MGHFTRYQGGLYGAQWDVALGDMDNDGYLDIITHSPGKVYYNDGHGNFSSNSLIYLPGGGVYTISLADFDNDGDLDVLYDGGSYNAYLIRNDGKHIY